MAEYLPDPHRLEIVDGLMDLEHDNPVASVSPAQLVLAAGDSSRYFDRALTETGEQIEGGSPRHWFFVIPAEGHQYKMTSLQFGMRNDDMTGHPTDEARFEHELAIDQTLRLNEGNPAVQSLFGKVGGFMIEAARNSGAEFVAGLEVRYKVLESNEVLRWVHLIYSKALLGTQRELQRAVNPDANNPAWLRKAILPRNKRRVAELMALSALAAPER